MQMSGSLCLKQHVFTSQSPSSTRPIFHFPPCINPCCLMQQTANHPPPPTPFCAVLLCKLVFLEAIFIILHGKEQHWILNQHLVILVFQHNKHMAYTYLQTYGVARTILKNWGAAPCPSPPFHTLLHFHCPSTVCFFIALAGCISRGARKLLPPRKKLYFHCQTRYL